MFNITGTYDSLFLVVIIVIFILLMFKTREELVDYFMNNQVDNILNSNCKEGFTQLDRTDALDNQRDYITKDDFGWGGEGDQDFPVVSCSNSSINEKFQTGEKQLLPSRIACNKPNKLTAENYYKTHFMALPVPLTDYGTKGYNYDQFSQYTHPTRLNNRILSQNTKTLPKSELKIQNIPVGFNYAFHNTPALQMP